MPSIIKDKKRSLRLNISLKWQKSDIKPGDVWRAAVTIAVLGVGTYGIIRSGVYRAPMFWAWGLAEALLAIIPFTLLRKKPGNWFFIMMAGVIAPFFNGVAPFLHPIGPTFFIFMWALLLLGLYQKKFKPKSGLLISTD